ncbi:MAG: dihydrolipoyl dehydrogenase [Oceanicaulis sp.]
MADLSCDVAVIGAGTAGLAAERSAREAGASTHLIDPDFAGTLCATAGCMPSKLLIASANAVKDVRKAQGLGIRAEPQIDGAAVMARVHRMRDHFVEATQSGIADLPGAVKIRARAKFSDTTTLELDDGRLLNAGAVVIATGAAPQIPPQFQGLGDRVLTHETVFDLPDLPASLAVIGSGPVGLELAQAMARLGVRVAQFDQADTIGHLPDPVIAARMQEVLGEAFAVHLGADPKPEPDGDGVRISWDGGDERFERVLVAAGRPPQVARLGLETTGLTLNEAGVPVFDAQTLQCGDAPVFIAGDANADAPVLHAASNEGAMAGRNAAAFPEVSKAERCVDFQIIFTDPPIAVIGAPPQDRHVIGEAEFRDQGRAKVEACNEGLARLYAEPQEGRLTGAVMAMPGGDHAAHLIAWAIERGETASAMLKLPMYHPTLLEGLKPALRDICAATPTSLPEDRDKGDPPGA